MGHPITPAATTSSVSGAGIADAAKKLSAAAYPLLQDIDWSSDLALMKPSGAGAPEFVKAIGDMDAKGVTTQADFEAINAGLGKAIASVPTSKVMDVYNAFSKIVSPDVPNYLYSSVNPQHAMAAYNGLLEFKNVVKAAR